MRALVIVLSAALASAGLAQTDFPTIFVANDGNLEGSVSSFSIAPDGTPVLIDKIVTGARANINEDQPGANVIAIDIAPSGRYLATGHATGSLSGDYVSIITVAPDGTMALGQQYLMPETTYSVAWISDDYLAVTQTIAFGTNQLVVLHYEPDSLVLTEVSRIYCGTFATRLLKHPTLPVLYVNDSGSSNRLWSFTVDQDGILALKQNLAVSHYPLGIELDRTGGHLFAAGGISSGGHAFSVFTLDDTGNMALVPGSPFNSPGQSPKGFTVHPDNEMLFVEHGTDATLRSFAFDDETGVPTNLGGSFDVGLQGTLGGSDSYRDWLYVTDESTAIDGIRGLYCLAINFANGQLTPVTPTPIETTGITPESVLIWAPPPTCRADVNSDGSLDFFDAMMFLQLFSDHDPQADFTGDGLFDFFDVSAFLQEFSDGCP
ncbi:MAG: hypothetical protein DYG94_00645 [Leptolyngbya sp. PLA3]|nr:MAG: hypothetical protein EDM82_01230 [Cyanobacteria bacterium CYA]MCE7967242.1 hypothetical protein [Leptolyngbya sp. PL-A3]